MRKLILTTAILSATCSLAAESLWHSRGNREISMYADRKAGHVGDILSVLVSESTSVTRSSSKSTATNGNVSHGVESFLFPSAATGFGKHNGSLPKIDISPSDNYSGEGSFSDSNTLTTRVAVLVVDRLPNGNLVVEGARKVDMAGEIQYVVLRGIVRGDDVTNANTVMSHQIVNANVEFFGEGDIADAQKKGWLMNLLDVVNVF